MYKLKCSRSKVKPSWRPVLVFVLLWERGAISRDDGAIQAVAGPKHCMSLYESYEEYGQKNINKYVSLRAIRITDTATGAYDPNFQEFTGNNLHFTTLAR